MWQVAHCACREESLAGRRPRSTERIEQSRRFALSPQIEQALNSPSEDLAARSAIDALAVASVMSRRNTRPVTNSVKSSTVFAPLRSEQALHVDAAERRRVDTGAGIVWPVSPTVWVAAFVWPFAWQSRQATPWCGFTLRRSSVKLNCCWGNGVSSSRSPSSCFWFRMSLKSRSKLASVTSSPFDTSPRSGRVVRKMAAGKSGVK